MRSIILLLLLAVSCTSADDPLGDSKRRQNQVAAYIERHADEWLFRPTPPEQQQPPNYPWNETASVQSLPHITKEYFRCRGSEFNPMRVLPNGSKGPTYLHDCAGTERHSLPLRNGEEFIYPILIDLLNDLQRKTGKRVIITSGYRCPAHNRYTDDTSENTTSKHMIGAAVTFYVQGLEEQPNAVIQQLLSYYETTPKYHGIKECLFTRDTSAKQPSSSPAWLNKEIAIRLFQRSEGRNFDNRHPYPYISLTVRYDWETQEKVIYSWDKAQRNYLRW